MGNKIPELDGNVSGKNGINRRDAISRGMGAIMASLLGTGALPAQDNAVAVVTNPQNIPGRSLETVAAQSGFAKTITGLQGEMVALQEEFKKGNIDSKKMEELLTKLLVNEKTITVEVQKTLDIIFERLGRTYKLLGESDKRRAEIKELGNTITNLKAGLSEGDNLIKGVRFIHELCSNEKYRNETSTLNKSYFKGMIEYIDTTIGGIIDGITKYEGSFQAMPSEEIKDLKLKLVSLKSPVEFRDLGTTKKGEIGIEMKTVKEGGILNINSTFSGIAHGEIKTENSELKMKFNQAGDCHGAKTEPIIIPKNTRRVQIEAVIAQKISNGELLPFYIIFQDEKGMSIGSGIMSKKNKETIDVPKGAKSCKLDIGVIRSKASGDATFSGLKILFK